ncbi:MAG: endolytic transglycosylase MltG [Halothiobacillaceae bacterium]|nr:endolytic transglycosylase MltG [Halothiobacillaceae bacterium]
MRRAIGAFLIWMLSMGWVVVVLAVAGLAYHYWQMPLVTNDTTVQVEPGESMRDVAATLHETTPSLPARVIYWTARFRGQARQIKAGEYAIGAGERLPTLLDRMVAGDVIEYRFTVPEGVTAGEFLAQLAEAPKVRHTLEALTPEAVIDALDLPVENLEGWLFPTTYHYPAGTTDVALLRRAYDQMREELDAAWAARADDLPIDTPYQALVLASLVEKETAVPDERGRIAGVFANRLERGMRLQTDPSVIYGMGDDYQGRLYTKNLREDSPYNTYTRGGLPPTPIALPSAASLRAATRPETTKALYFVADGSGGHAFSRTLEEHNRAVSRWRQQKREAEASP